MTKVQFSDNKFNKLIRDFLKDLDQEKTALWALDCAEHVLPYFFKSYPQDLRPQKAIEAGRAWAGGEIKVSKVRAAAFASHAAARDAEERAAKAAARSAGQAAATAYFAGHAIHAADYAVKAVAYAAGNMKAAAESIREREWQYQLLLELFKDNLLI